MKMLGNRQKNVSKAESRGLLPSSINILRDSALEFGVQETHTNLLLEQLATLIVGVYFDEHPDTD